MVMNTYEVYDVYEKMIMHMDLEDSLVENALDGNRKAKNKIAYEFSQAFSRGKKRRVYIRFSHLEYTKLTDNHFSVASRGAIQTVYPSQHNQVSPPDLCGP